MNQEELLQKAKENLPKEYVSAVKKLNIAERIDSIGRGFDLSNKQTALLDQEVVYLLLGITDSPEFTERLAERLKISNDNLLEVINAVTDKLLKPLSDSITGAEKGGASMAVPPPPPAPNTGYGGTSDPYREPAE